MPQLVVVIVSWNTSQLTRDCLNSLMPDLKAIDHEIWVVDNDSSDDSREMIRNEFPQVRLVENRENVGFAKANNQVLRQAEGEYYLLQNSDTIAPTGAIKALLEFLENHPEAAAVGPRLHNGKGAVEPPLKPLPSLAGEWRYCLAYHSGPLAPFFRGLLSYRRVDWRSLKSPTPAEVLSAACLMFRREVIDKAGLLPEDYFLFSEENDLFTRMNRAGLRGYYHPGIEMVHLLGRSRKKRGSIDSEVNFLRSRLLYFRKFRHHQLRTLKMTYKLFFWASLTFHRVLRPLKPNGRRETIDLYSRLLSVLNEG